jgi:hypothetical protein
LRWWKGIGVFPHLVNLPWWCTIVTTFFLYHLPLAPTYPVELLNTEIEYDVDSEDEQFLQKIAERQFINKDGSEFVMDETTFEIIIDHLEKQSFDEVKQHRYTSNVTF